MNLLTSLKNFSIDLYIKYPSVQQESDYFRPFNQDLWIAVLGIIIINAFIMFLLTFANIKLKSEGRAFNYVDCFFVAFDCFLNQGTVFNRKLHDFSYHDSLSRENNKKY